jgi:hypothetical protein
MPVRDYLRRVGRKPQHYSFGESPEFYGTPTMNFSPGRNTVPLPTNLVVINKSDELRQQQEARELEARAERDAQKDMKYAFNDRPKPDTSNMRAYLFLLSAIVLGTPQSPRNLTRAG